MRCINKVTSGERGAWDE